MSRFGRQRCVLRKSVSLNARLRRAVRRLQDEVLLRAGHGPVRRDASGYGYRAVARLQCEGVLREVRSDGLRYSNEGPERVRVLMP